MTTDIYALQTMAICKRCRKARYRRVEQARWRRLLRERVREEAVRPSAWSKVVAFVRGVSWETEAVR